MLRQQQLMNAAMGNLNGEGSIQAISIPAKWQCSLLL